MVRFALVGIANTGVDMLFLNGLLFLYPTRDVGLLVLFNSLAYTVGAVNSFVLNKYWTFQLRKAATTRREAWTFVVISALGICCNNILLALFARTPHPLFLRPVLWTNIAKICAVTGTAFISFLGMRLWVFAGSSLKKKEKRSREGVSSPGEAPLN
jgi:putative flippase GtrA